MLRYATFPVQCFRNRFFRSVEIIWQTLLDHFFYFYSLYSILIACFIRRFHFMHGYQWTIKYSLKRYWIMLIIGGKSNRIMIFWNQCFVHENSFESNLMVYVQTRISIGWSREYSSLWWHADDSFDLIMCEIHCSSLSMIE